jgi:hypothetical protein
MRLFNWRIGRLRGTALGLWGAGCLTPGVLVALNKSQHAGAAAHARNLSRIYEHDMGAYLAYCPSALLAYLIPLLVLSPVLILLFSLGEESARAISPSRVTLVALRLACTWAVANAVGLLIIAGVMSLSQNRDAAVGGWALRLWVSLVFSGLPSVGLSLLVIACFESRRAALLAGLSACGVLGYLGTLARDFGWVWLPGALDQALFAGASRAWLRAALFACLWFAAWVGGAAARRHFRQRGLNAAQSTRLDEALPR